MPIYVNPVDKSAKLAEVGLTIRPGVPAEGPNRPLADPESAR